MSGEGEGRNGGLQVGGLNKQKNMGGERRNRRVLQDIGNLVAKQGHGNGINVSKPVTRNFRAQLLANAQAATEVEFVLFYDDLWIMF
ncbi:hypothetical protein JHK85_001563 [Glycine max]|nr:hypothetical protein JHK85_001563 [Glycine max]